jgi:hypothetical protein
MEFVRAFIGENAKFTPGQREVVQGSRMSPFEKWYTRIYYERVNGAWTIPAGNDNKIDTGNPAIPNDRL